MNKKLVIWDFDGVIADSEKIYIENRQKYINEIFGLNWDFQTTINYLGGLSDFSNREVLNKLGYITDDKFWENLVNLDIEKMNNGGLKVIPGIENIIKKLPKQCVATGGLKSKTIHKLTLIDFWNKYFNDRNLFTVDMVEHGKPEPDLFLFAAKQMGEKPENCIVIEDSVAGITAAQKARMNVIAFLGCEIYCHNDTYIEKIKQLGIKYICYNSKNLENILMRNYEI